MSVVFKQLRVYLRGSLIALLSIAIGVALFKNRSNSVSFWFFGLTDPTKSVNVLWVILWTAIATLGSWWTLSLGWGLLSDMREIKRARKISDAAQALGKREAALDQRERRVDRKLHQAISDEEQPAED